MRARTSFIGACSRLGIAPAISLFARRSNISTAVTQPSGRPAVGYATVASLVRDHASSEAGRVAAAGLARFRALDSPDDCDGAKPRRQPPQALKFGCTHARRLILRNVPGSIGNVVKILKINHVMTSIVTHNDQTDFRHDVFPDVRMTSGCACRIERVHSEDQSP